MHGFTLLEVMVALAIIAIALGAMTKAAGENSHNAAYLRDKTFAHWVAMNKAAELEISRAWPQGNSEGTAQMAGRDWHWHLSSKPTDDRNLRRYALEVRYEANDANPLASLTGFLLNPDI